MIPWVSITVTLNCECLSKLVKTRLVYSIEKFIYVVRKLGQRLRYVFIL